jgi:hypothetical protein
MVRNWRIVAACAGWLGLGMFLIDLVTARSDRPLIEGLVNYFSYFTILSNYMVAIILTLLSVSPQSRIGSVAGSADVRTCVALYIMVTGVVYLIFLSHLSPPRTLRYTANVLLHYVVPVMYVVDWLFFVPKGTLRVKQVWAWLIFPLAYAGYTFLHGALSGFYPYPFMNVTKLGYPHVLLNCVFLTIGFALLGLLMVAIDRWMGAKKLGHSQRSGTVR